MGKSTVDSSTRHLLTSIHKSDAIAIRTSIARYKESGRPLFVNLLAIHDRIPRLVNVYGQKLIHAVVASLLGSFCNSFNVVRPMTPEQIMQCAFDMIESANEDQLSIEDIVIFFDQARQGNYGKVYDRLDQQTIFELFESYRQARHEAFRSIQETKHLERKGQGPADRNDVDEIQQAMSNYVGRMENMKERLREKSSS